MTAHDDIVGVVNITPDTQAVLLVLRDDIPLADRDGINESLRSVSTYLGVPLAAVSGVDHVCSIVADPEPPVGTPYIGGDE